MGHPEAIAALVSGYVEEQIDLAVGSVVGERDALEQDLVTAKGEVERLTRELSDAADAGAAKDLSIANLTQSVGRLEAELAGLNAGPVPSPTVQEPRMGVPIESFPGRTDDDKLEAAWSYAMAQDEKPAVQLGNREYSFTRPQQIMNGKKLVGPVEVATQQRGAKSYSCLVKVNVAGGGAWLRMPSSGNVFDFELSRLSFMGGSTTDLIGGGGGVMWTSNIHDLAAINFRHVLGSPSAKLLLTACTFGGTWNVNNSRGRAVTIGGSDNSLWESGLALFDSPTNLSGSTDAHIVFDYMSKSKVGGLYITAEGGPAGMIVNGGTSSFGMSFNGLVIEGRNAGAPSLGSALRINGGTNTFNDLSLNYAATNLTGTPRANEQGAISVFGGNTIFDKVQYARANGVSEDMPMIYATGASTKVSAPRARGVGPGWSNKPAIKAANGAIVEPDSSVRLIGV